MDLNDKKEKPDHFYDGYGWEVISVLFPFIGPLYLALDKRGSKKRRGFLGVFISLILFMFMTHDIYQNEPDESIIINLENEKRELVESNEALRAKLEAIYQRESAPESKPIPSPEAPKSEPGLISVNLNGINYDLKNVNYGEYKGLHQVVFRHQGKLNNIRFKDNGTFISIQQDNVTLRSNAINARLREMSDGRLALIWRQPLQSKDSTILIQK